MALLERIRTRVLDAFRYEDERRHVVIDNGPSSADRPDRRRLRFYNERSIISAIYTRLSIDIAAIDIRHVELDDKGRYKKNKDSLLNACFTVEANQDQAPRHFRQDIALSLFDEGTTAIVPVDAVLDTLGMTTIDVKTLRVGRITQWYPERIRVEVYNIKTGLKQEVTLPKRLVAIVENPMYAVMNENNSTLQRLIRKLNLLDAVDEQSGSGRLDLIIQLPYSLKTETKRQAAEQRRKDIEWQLKGSQYGIAYTDATEKITQLNRPSENNLLEQIKFLTDMLYGQLGLTPEVMNGTADEATMRNYFNRTIEPYVTAITEAMHRSFVRNSTDEAIRWFHNPFKLVPIKDLADIADKFIRNEILTSNELRELMGLPPSSDPEADKLRNPNMPEEDKPPGQPPQQSETSETSTSERNSQNAS